VQTTIFSTTQINSLASSYNPLSPKQDLICILDSFLGISTDVYQTKFDVHKQINDLLIDNYVGESTIKHFLFTEFLNKNVVAAFETKVSSSRVDFLVINGETKSFEIKSGLDNLTKLYKQSTDYNKAFEYNHVVVDEKHLDKLINVLPVNYGIWSYRKSKKTIHRKPSLNNRIDSDFQLTLLTKNELQRAFGEFDGNREEILKNLNFEEINIRFKNILKLRYLNKWSFITENSESILPIDIQFFFSKNLNPKLVYQIRS
jgi:hypothetical protein